MQQGWHGDGAVSTLTLELPGAIQLDLLEQHGKILGLGEVRCGTVPLRNGRRPLFVDIRNPWGVQLCDYRLAARQEIDGGWRLTFRMNCVAGGQMEWQLHECRPMRQVADWSLGPEPAEDTDLELELLAVHRRIGSREFTGFSYQYHYRSRGLPIYQILDRGTWEPGGSAAACELWLRNGNAPCIYRPSGLADHYSTEWYLPSCTNANIFQFLPLQTHLQGFTMTASEAGTLVTWSPEVYHLRTLLEKPRGTDLFVHLHEHCGDLAPVFSSAQMEVLFCPGPTSRIDRANLHGDLLDLVAETLHGHLELRRERVPTYGQIEEWTDADLELYRREGLPTLAEAGITYVELANHFQNNMNTWGLSNMCATVDYKIAETVGADKLQAFCHDAQARGVRVGMWGNTAISTLTERFWHRNGTPKRIDYLPREGSIMAALQTSARPFVLNSYGAIEADHYTPVFCALNLRDPVVRSYWLTAWERLLRETGITGIFLDSSFNMSSDKFDWRYHAEPQASREATVDQTHLLGSMRPPVPLPGTIHSQYLAHLTLVRAMQRLGYLYCGEDSGVFGIHRNGPGLLARLDNLFMWADFVAAFNAPALRAAGADPAAIFFRGLAYRLMWGLFWHVSSRRLSFDYGGQDAPEDRPGDWHFALYHAYNEVQAHMQGREILADECGVVYRHGGRLVLWAFADFAFPLPAAVPVRDVLAGVTTPATTIIHAQRQRIYLA